MTEPSITPELVAQHNLTPEEYAKIRALLGREPSYTELGVFSVMWSEHCSYKNTRPLLKTFPTKSPRILVGAGEENAGIIDIGDGLAIAFKIESHNHPSAVEPFQGAATGLGGIIRDIFTMGARPVCAMDSLRFGPITGEESAIRNPQSAILQNRRLFAGVVSGVAHYGNCFGIPTLAAKFVLTSLTRETASSTSFASVCCAMNKSRAARPGASAIPSSTSAPPPAATASRAPPLPRRI